VTEAIKIAHALPGRVRLKVAKVKGNPGLARKAQEKLAAVPGIQQVEANPLTGSVLVLFDLATLAAESLEPLAEVLAEFSPEITALSLMSWLTSMAADPDSGANPGGSLIAGVQALNAEVGRITGGLDLKLLLPLALLFFGVRGLLAAEKTTFPAWHDYFWFGFSSLVMLNRGWFEGREPETASSPITQGVKGGDLKEKGKAGLAVAN
jgi:hypothetical protein